jgi:hypothetical protein
MEQTAFLVTLALIGGLVWLAGIALLWRALRRQEELTGELERLLTRQRLAAPEEPPTEPAVPDVERTPLPAGALTGRPDWLRRP